jgi:tetratricopeptide (TPR) repeat protein
MGIINNNNKKYSEAISYYSEAIKRDAEYADAWSELGSLYIKNNEFPKGDSCYGQALALEPDNPLYNNNFAYALSERSSELYKAQELAKKAISLDPENSSYLDTYGWILFKQGNINKAILILEKAVRITSEQSAIILYHLSEAYKQAKEDDKAHSTLKKALLIDPENLLYIKSLENPK